MSFCDSGKKVISIEAEAVAALEKRIDQHFTHCCELILACQGRVIVTGMGKSGHIAKKIAATFASTGTPAFFVHPSEANHGDMGMITVKDVALTISYSGETAELNNLLPLIKSLSIPLIALCGKKNSTLVNMADVFLDVSIEKEACPLGLAPTASTTAMLAMGDALAIALLEARGFSADDFARFHPGGSLGRQLRMRVAELMHKGDAIPRVSPECRLAEALIEITKKRLGMTTILDSTGKLVGVYTDGDLRRTLDKGINIHEITMQDIMTSHCITVAPTILASEVFKMMKKFKITNLPIVNENHHVLGIIHIHDLLNAGIH